MHAVLTEERAALAEEYMPLAYKTARAMRRPSWIERQEAESQVLEALVLLARDWDPERAAKFGTYVVGQLRHRVIDLIRSEVGRKGQRLLPLLRFESGDPIFQTEHPPGVTYVDFLVDPDPGPEEVCLTSIGPDPWTLVDELERKNPRGATVLRLRYRDGLTQCEVGERFGVTGARISQIESRALEQIRRRADREIFL